MGNDVSQDDRKRHSNPKNITKSAESDAPTNIKQLKDSDPKNKSVDEQKQYEFEYIDDKIVKMDTPEYKFQIGEKIDARDNNGIWRQCTILDIIQSKSDKNIYGFLKVSFVNMNTKIKIEVTGLNICFCNEYCFKYNPTQLKWSNHMLAAPNTQSKKWKELQISLFNYNINTSTFKNNTDIKYPQLQPLHYKFTLIVFGFMRQNYEELHNKLIPMDIKQIIYMFWEYWSQLKQRDVLRIKSCDGIWQGAVVTSKCRVKSNMKELQITFAYCPNILKKGDYIDAKDCDGKWYLAEIIAIKRPRKRFPMNPPSKFKKKKLKKFAAIYVHFMEFGNRFNEWICMKDGVMCSCCGVCWENDHRVTFAKTQSDNYNNSKGTQVLCITENSFCDCVEKCRKNEHRLKYTEDYQIVRSSDMFCFC